MRLVLAALAALSVLPAAAHDHCPAPGRHEKFGEQRAYFQDVLGACRADGFCSAVVATKARDGAAFAQQLRIARLSPGEEYQVDFAAASPMPKELTSVDVRVGRLSLNAPTSAIAGNEFRVAERANIEAIVAAARKSRSLRWTYATADGIEAATFGLRGLTAALNWIDCMGQSNSPPAEMKPLSFPAGDAAKASRDFQAELTRRYGGLTDAAAISSDMQYQGIDCQPANGAPGVLECQRTRPVADTVCFDVWRAVVDAKSTPMVRGDYARRCLGALPPKP